MVAALFSTKPQGVLLPTVSDKVRNTPAELLDYFVSFLQREPRAVMDIIAGASPNAVALSPTAIVNSGAPPRFVVAARQLSRQAV